MMKFIKKLFGWVEKEAPAEVISAGPFVVQEDPRMALSVKMFAMRPKDLTTPQQQFKAWQENNRQVNEMLARKAA